MLLPLEREEYAEPEGVIVAGVPAYAVDIAPQAVEPEEAPVLRHKLDVLGDLAIHFEVVTGSFR